MKIDANYLFVPKLTSVVAFGWTCGSVWVMMNKKTRRLSKIPDEVRQEIGPYFVDSPPVLDDDSRKLPKLDEHTADYVCSGLTVSTRLCDYEGYFLL